MTEPVRRVPAPTYPTFPRQEIAARIQRLCEALGRSGIEVLLLTARENVVYFSGLSSSAWVQRGVTPAVLMTEAASGKTTMALPDFWLGTAEKTTWVDDFALHRNSHSDPDDFARFVVQTVTDRNPRVARIGYEAGHEMLLGMPLRQYEQVRAGLSSASWLDAGPAIWEARMIKSPAEVDRLRRSAHVAGRAQEKVREAAHPGVDERELGWLLRRELLQPDGSEQDRIFINLRAGTERYSMTDTYPKPRQLREGDLLVCDTGIFLEGYASDTARVISIGEPRDLYREVYGHILAARDAALDLVRPGTPASAVYEAVRSVFNDSGLPAHIDMVGHGIGLNLHEPPMLSPGNDTPLQESMVVCIEPWVTLPNDEGVLTVEDTYLVTRDGREQLTLPNADDLWRVVAA